MQLAKTYQLDPCLNWTKVGLKAIRRHIDGTNRYRLNWTKVGLKASKYM